MLSWAKRNKYSLIFWLIFLVHLGITYYGVVIYRYPVAPGDDTLAHLQFVDGLKKNPLVWPSKGYPPGIHYLLLWTSSATGITTSHVLANTWPLFVVGTGLSIFYLTKRFFNVTTALIAYVLFALVCPQPLQTAYDGGWPNIIATGIFLPIALVFWAKLWQRFTWTGLGVFILSGLVIVYTHHLSTVMWLTILLVSGTLLVTARAIRECGWRRLILPVTWLAGSALVYFIFTRTEVFGAAKMLTNFSLSTNDSPIWPIKIYLSSLSGIVFQFSLIGLILAGWKIAFIDKFSAKSFYLIVLVSWFLTYFVISRLPVAEPGRAARDLSLPAAVLAAYALKNIIDRLSGDKLLRNSFILLIVTASLVSFCVKAEGQLRYNPMIRFSKADSEALAYINASGGPYPYLVWARNGFWTFEAKSEIESGRIILVGPSELNEVADGVSCGLLGYYKPGIWQEFLQDRSVLDQYSSRADLRVDYLVEDSTKIWYLLCKKQ